MKRQPYSLPDKDCERLRRPEMTAVRMLLAAVSIIADAQEDLRNRLECVPYGNQRMRLTGGGLGALISDLLGTVSKSQCEQLMRTAHDFEMRLLPKATPMVTNIVMTKDQGKCLMDCARWACHACVKDGESCRECQLYKILEATTPLDDYGDGMLCPYALAEWEE